MARTCTVPHSFVVIFNFFRSRVEYTAFAVRDCVRPLVPFRRTSVDAIANVLDFRRRLAASKQSSELSIDFREQSRNRVTRVHFAVGALERVRTVGDLFGAKRVIRCNAALSIVSAFPRNHEIPRHGRSPAFAITRDVGSQGRTERVLTSAAHRSHGHHHNLLPRRLARFVDRPREQSNESIRNRIRPNGGIEMHGVRAAVPNRSRR